MELGNYAEALSLLGDENRLRLCASSANCRWISFKATSRCSSPSNATET